MSQRRPAPVEISALLEQLAHPKSSVRRSAAKKLRKAREPSAGPALLAALQNEVRDPRTWETQYQMVMALAETAYVEASALLGELQLRPLAPVVLVAVGDALVRLARSYPDDPAPILGLLDSGTPALFEGGLRAVAMLHLALTPESVRRIMEAVSRPEHEAARFWAAAAAPGWQGAEVEAFLTRSLEDRSAEVRKAAEAALRHEYLRWRPL
jgi:HEAT repeat protein